MRGSLGCGLLLLAVLGNGAFAADPAEEQAVLARSQERVAQILALRNQARFAEALALALENRDDVERVLGREHLEYAGALTYGGMVLRDLGRLEESRQALAASLEIYRRQLGAEHPWTAAALSALGGTLLDLGRTEEGRALLEEAWRATERSAGATAPETGTALNNYVRALNRAGRYAEAVPLAERTLKIALQAHGPRSAETATARNNLGRSLYGVGDFDGAAREYVASAETFERVLGATHPMTATGWLNVGQVLRESGRLGEARTMTERAHRAFVGALGPRSYGALTSLSNLAEIVHGLGEVERGRAMAQQAVDGLEATVGPEHPMTLTATQGLAVMLHGLGRDEEAKRLLERVVAQRMKDPTVAPAETAFAHSALGLVLDALGQVEDAHATYTRGLALHESLFGARHPDTAVAATNLATLLHRRLKRSAEARALLVRALEDFAAVYGEDHPRTAGAATSLAVVEQDLGRLDAAQALFERALRGHERSLGADHPSSALAHSNLAALLDRKAQHAQALGHLDRALDALERHLRATLVGLSASERLSYAASLREFLGNYLRIAPMVGEVGYERVLRFKGLVARVEEAERRLLQARSDATAPIMDALESAQRTLSRLAGALPRASDEAARRAWQSAYAAASAAREDALARLVKSSPGYREALAPLELTAAQVAAALPEGAALLDLMAFPEGYVGWILTRGTAPALVSVGTREEVEADVQAFVADVARGEHASPEATAAAARLRHALIDAVLEVSGPGLRTLYVSPDAALASLPFAALPGAREGTFLLDDLDLVWLAMAQDLVPWASRPPAARAALLVGGVDYEQAAPPGSPAVAEPKPPTDADAAPTAPGEDSSRGSRFRPLPGSAREAAALAKRLAPPVSLLQGAQATEESLRRLAPTCRVLHLATHGFVRNDPQAALRPTPQDASSWRGAGRERMLAGYDPRLLAGIALAGANRGTGGGDDDGILTALEASYLDLRGCSLAVLSACDTAQGRPEDGQGVVGMVQSLQMAGAQDVVASLWKVDDEATRLLMERFYALWLDAGSPSTPPAALRQAAHWLRGAKPGGRDYAAPRHWASFVCYARR